MGRVGPLGTPLRVLIAALATPCLQASPLTEDFRKSKQRRRRVSSPLSTQFGCDLLLKYRRMAILKQQHNLSSSCALQSLALFKICISTHFNLFDALVGVQIPEQSAFIQFGTLMLQNGTLYPICDSKSYKLNLNTLILPIYTILYL